MLIYEAESAELDFKREQYPFSKADERQKAELLKDIIAFANAWRRSDAYILIGVQESKEAASIVVGIEEHIDDSRLQQFVNSKTSRPIEFSYIPAFFQGKQIGIIHIPMQERPTFLLKDYGHLRKNVVYLRRGSSTDEARPDEIARMGMAASEHLKPQPHLTSGFSTSADSLELLKIIHFEIINLSLPELDTIPDYIEPRPSSPFGFSHYQLSSMENSDFYRERAEYIRFHSKLRPIKIGVNNEGNAISSGTKLRAQIEDPEHINEILVASRSPRKPKKRWPPTDNIRPISFNQKQPDIELTKTKNGWTINAYLGKIQAKDTSLTSEQLYIGTSKNGKIKLDILIFADELSSPISESIELEFKVDQKEVDIEIVTH